MPSSVSLITYLKNSSFNIRSSEVFKLTVETSNLINLNIRLANCYCLYLFILADKCPPTRMPSSTFFCPQSLQWMAYSSLYVIMCLGCFFLWSTFPVLCHYFEGLVHPNYIFLTCLLGASIQVDFVLFDFEIPNSEISAPSLIHWIVLMRAVRMSQNSKFVGQNNGLKGTEMLCRAEWNCRVRQ